MFIKPTPSVFLKVPKFAWPNLQTMGGGNFLALHGFSILWTSSQECHGKRTWDPSWEWYLRAIGATELAQSLAQLRFWNHILVDWIWYAPWRSCYNARLKCVCIITSHTSTKKTHLGLHCQQRFGLSVHQSFLSGVLWCQSVVTPWLSVSIHAKQCLEQWCVDSTWNEVGWDKL